MLSLLLFVLAQDIDLGETVITAPRSAATVTATSAKTVVIKGEELVATGERSLPRALGQTAGVWVQETNIGGGAPVIRGQLGARILILVDGVRLNDSTTRLGPNQSLNAIDPAIVDRIEVTKGSNSVLYGSDAIGGVVAIWTKRRRSSTQDSQEYLRPYQGHSEGTWDSALEGTRLSLELSGAYQDHGAIGIASGIDFNRYKAGDNETVLNTGYNGHSYFGSYEYALGKRQTLRFTARVNRDFNVPRTDKLNVGFGQSEPTHEDWRYSLQDRRGWVLSYTDQEAGDFADQMQIRLNLHTYNEERDRQETGSPRSTFERDEVVTVGLGVDWQKAIGEDHLLTWGVDLSHDKVDSIREDTEAGVVTEAQGAFAPDSRYTRFGAFLQDEIFGFDPWFFTVGVRFSAYDFEFGDNGQNVRTSDQFSALTASVEAARDLGDGMLFTAGISQGFRAPNLDDLANQGDFAGGTELANADLDPEQSVTLETGLEVTRQDWRGALSVFGSHIDDYIGRVLIDQGDPGTDGDETYMRENTGEVQLVGAELGYWAHLGDADSPYAFDASVAYVRGRQKDSSFSSGSFPARRVPPLHGHLALNYEPEEPEWFYLPNARASILWADSQNRLHPQDTSDPRIDPNGTASWLTYNLEVWGNFNPDASWRVGLLNLSDESYRVHASGVNAPGRRLVVGLRLEF